MKPTSLVLPLTLILAAGAAAPARAIIVPGGKAPKSDCYVGFEVEGTSHSAGATLNGTNKADQLSCGGTCTFTVKTCINEPVSGCTAATVSDITVKKVLPSGSPPPLPATLNTSEHVCSTDSGTYTVPLKNGKKIGKQKFIVLSGTTDGRPKKDPDKLILRCLPNAGDAGCGTPSSTTLQCANPAGGPDQVNLTVLGNGTDLDNGWTGTSFNFPVIKDASFSFCISDCTAPDAASPNPVCTINGPTGADTPNGATFGPPLPLIAGGVAVCVVNRFQTIGPNGITGTFRLDTGETDGQINLFSDVFVTDATRVCPRCETGTCDSGVNRNKPCTVHGTVQVVNSAAPNKLFKLSRDCPPLGQPTASLNIPLRPTTGTVGTPGTGGSKPCHENEANGVTVQDDNCGAAGCGSDNCTGNSCVTKIDDPSMPGHQICVDVKGGLSQNCCNSQTFVPCFPTRPGGPGIVRTGRAVPANPPWPDPSYPKTVEGLVQVSTFCEAATGNPNVDGVTGLPGAGAVVFNLRADVLKTQ